jgi:ABC-type multidrug transport system ATPase subunit
MMPPVRIEGLVKRFGSLVAVDSVSLAVERGEVVGLLGANGAGKTTLIRALLGLVRPDGGEVRLLGEAPSRAVLRRVGYVPQGLGLYPDLTVDENLAFRSAIYGRTTAGSIDADLASVGSSLLGDTSLGVQRRVAFAAALLPDPAILVLDEPTSGVGPLNRVELWSRIRSRADAGEAVLITTHHFDEAEQCDRLVLMAAGRTVAEGTVTDIIGDLTATEVTADDWQRSLDALTEAGLSVSLRGRTLRVLGSDADTIGDALRAHGIDAIAEQRAATLEEAFQVLSS